MDRGSAASSEAGCSMSAGEAWPWASQTDSVYPSLLASDTSAHRYTRTVLLLGEPGTDETESMRSSGTFDTHTASLLSLLGHGSYDVRGGGTRLGRACPASYLGAERVPETREERAVSEYLFGTSLRAAPRHPADLALSPVSSLATLPSNPFATARAATTDAPGTDAAGSEPRAHDGAARWRSGPRDAEWDGGLPGALDRQRSDVAPENGLGRWAAETALPLTLAPASWGTATTGSAASSLLYDSGRAPRRKWAGRAAAPPRDKEADEPPAPQSPSAPYSDESDAISELTLRFDQSLRTVSADELPAPSPGVSCSASTSTSTREDGSWGATRLYGGSDPTTLPTTSPTKSPRHPLDRRRGDPRRARALRAVYAKARTEAIRGPPKAQCGSPFTATPPLRGAAQARPHARQRGQPPQPKRPHRPPLSFEGSHLAVSGSVQRHLWAVEKKRMKARASSTRTNRRRKRPSELERVGAQEQRRVGRTHREAGWARRAEEQRLHRHHRLAAQARTRDRRQAQARLHRCGQAAQRQQRSRALRRQSREELLVRRLFEHCLQSHRDRIRETRREAKEQQEQADREHRLAAESLEHHYRTQVDLLDEALEEEQRAVARSSKSRARQLARERSDLRHRLEGRAGELCDRAA